MGLLKEINFIFSMKEKMKILILVFLLFISALLEMIGVAAILPIINILVKPIALENSHIKIMYDFFKCKSLDWFLVYCMILLVLIYILKNIYLFLVYKYQYSLIAQGQKKLAVKLMDCYMYQPYKFYLETNTAEVQRNSDADVTRFYQAVQLFLQFITDILICLVIGSYLIITDWIMTIFILGGLVICLYCFMILYKKKLKILGEESRNIGAELFKWISQAFGGIKEIRILGKEEYFINKYAAVYDTYTDISKRSSLISVTPKLIIESISILMLALAILIKLTLGTNMTEFVPQLAAIAVAAFKMLPSFNRLSTQLNQIMYLKPSVDSVYRDLKEGINLENNRIEYPVNEELHLEKSISLKNLTFKYNKEGLNVLDDLSINIKVGESVAIIGMSGGGKTTLIDIILGLLVPDSGQVLVDDRNINTVLRAWNKNIGYIPQNIYLIDDSIKNNIAFGIDESSINMSRLEDVLKLTQLNGFVSKLPNGLNTIVGEMGSRLSGGQRQRIGIARALYRDPDVLILDEATSALDNETEEAIMEAIDSFRGIKTMIIIAHRLKTIEKCDVIYKIENGKAILQ